MATDRVRESIVIAQDAETILGILADVAAYPTWLDEFKEAEVLETDAQGRPARARFRIAALGVALSFELSYRWDEHGMAWHLVRGDMLQVVDGSYALAEQGDGYTVLTYVLEVRSTVPLPNPVRRRIEAKIIGDTLAGTKRRAESRRAEPPERPGEEV